MDLLRRLLAPERRELTTLQQLLEDRRGWSTWSGVNVNERTAMQHVTVWACVTLIADALAMMEPHTMRDVSLGVPERVDDPEIVTDPHDEMSRFDWHVQLAWSILMRGNAYAEVLDRGRGAIPTQLEPWHPDDVSKERDKETGELFYRVGRDRRRVDRENMLHLPGLTVPGTRTGLDPITFARQTIGTGLAAVEYGARFFNEGAVPPGILTTDKPMDRDTAAEYQARWEDAHGRRQRKVAVLGGGLSYEAIQVDPANTQFLETIGATKADVAGFFRCPPHLVGDVERSTSWGTGIEEQGAQFVAFTMNPWIRRFEYGWRRVLRPSGLYVTYDTSELLRGRAIDRAAYLRTMREIGAFNIDDARATEKLGPLPDGKGTDYLQPLNYAPIPPGGGLQPGADVTPGASSSEEDA